MCIGMYVCPCDIVCCCIGFIVSILGPVQKTGFAKHWS